jgi:hypothetical protein
MDMTMMSTGMNPNLVTAIDHLFTDFDETFGQVLASKSPQQFVMNEANMITVLAMDLAQIRTLM